MNELLKWSEDLTAYVRTGEGKGMFDKEKRGDNSVTVIPLLRR
jgi:hypothetical protein